MASEHTWWRRAMLVWKIITVVGVVVAAWLFRTPWVQAAPGTRIGDDLAVTLATLKAQIEADPPESSATTDRLAALFRQVLSFADRPTVPLREELGFVETYLGIEQARLGRRLRVKIEIPEEVEGIEIPSLTLQSLVENAVKHGIAPSEQGSELNIWARWNGPGSGRKLLVGVESPAAPAVASPAPSTGTGLATLRGRLAQPEDLTTIRSLDRFRAEFLWKGAPA